MKDKKKMGIIVLSVFAIVAVISVTYAFITQTLTGTKEVVINAGTLDLVLEEENAITISDAFPMYDEVGMIQEEAFEFRLVNKTSNPTNYILKLQAIETGTLNKSDVKYGLIKDEERIIDLVSNIVDGIIDKGTIAGNDTIDYSLRLWIKDSVTEISQTEGKFLSLRLGLTAEQKDTLVVDDEFSVVWSKEDGYLETVQSSSNNQYYVKLSDEIATEEKLLGLNLYTELNNSITSCGSQCVYDMILTQSILDNVLVKDETTGITSANNVLWFVSEPAEITSGVELSSGIWTIGVMGSDNNLVSAIDILEITKVKKTTFMMAGLTKEAIYPTKAFFDYDSEGCRVDLTSNSSICSREEMNGIYVMDDEDGPSYFYRGKVNNLVKFGEYTQDYYSYRYTTSSNNTYDFTSLESCKLAYPDCTEENKVLKYSAGTPMYWKIIRVNGDGTIRMIYSGTTPDATSYDTNIGISTYNDCLDNKKCVGFTWDRSTSETSSVIKNELDKWYQNTLEGTSYDEKISISKFCNDTSGYEEEVSTNYIENIFANFGVDGVFEPFKRFAPELFELKTRKVTFNCPETTEDFGGIYNLKVGLISLDEVKAAGLTLRNNDTYYLASGAPVWTMSPLGGLIRKDQDNKYLSILASFSSSVNFLQTTKILDDAGTVSGSVRPVINLRKDVVFKEGTDGSVLTPYELTE